MLPIREHRSDPWSGNEDPTCGVVWPKRITIMKIEIVCLIPLCTYQRPTLAAVSLTERNLKGIFEFIENKVKRKTQVQHGSCSKALIEGHQPWGWPRWAPSWEPASPPAARALTSIDEPLSLTCIYSVASSERRVLR